MRKKRNLNEFEFVEKKDNGKTQEELGKGAFGRVRLALDKLTNTKVAIKTIPKKLLKDNNQTENMKREIKLHRKLDHAHIVKLFHSLEDDQNVFLVLEYVPNGNLFVYLKKKRKLSEPEAFVFFLQTALAIDYLHKKGIIHRDLKPENMLLDENGNIKICDFGWSAELQPDRRTFCGTLDYMCPEMLNSQNHDHRVDIWALGILLYEMLHGYAPFNKNRQPQDIVIKAILNAGTTTIQFGEKLSDDVKNLINSLLKFNPKDRLSMEQIFSHKWLKLHANQMEIDIPSFVYEKGLDDTITSVSNMSIHVDQPQQSKFDNYQSQALPQKLQQSQQNYQSQQLSYQSQAKESTTPTKKPTFDPLFQSTNLNNLFQSTNNVQNFQPQQQQQQQQQQQDIYNQSTSKSPSRLTPEQQQRKNQLLGLEESKNMQQSGRMNYQMQASQEINKSIQRDQSPNQSNIYSNPANKPNTSPNSKMAQSQMIINKYTSSNNSSMFKSQDIANQSNQQSDEFQKYMSQEQERKKQEMAKEQERKKKEDEFRKQQLADIQRREEQIKLEESRRREEMERSRKLREQELENQRKIREFEEEQKRLIEQEKLRKQREQEELLQKQREQELEKQRREQELEQLRREKEEQDRIRREQLKKDQEQREEQRKREEQQQQLKREQEERQRREQERWEQEQKDRLRREKEEQERQKKQYEEMQQEKIRQQEKQRQQYEEQLRLQKQQEQDRKLREFEEQKRQLNRSNSKNMKTQESEEDRQAKRLKDLEQKARQEYQQHLINQSQASQASQSNKSNNESRQQRRQLQDDDLFIGNNNNNSYVPQKQTKDMNDEEFELEQKLHNMLVQNLQLDLPPITQTVKPDESSKLDWDVSVIENQQKQNPLLNQYENIQQVNVMANNSQNMNRSVSPNTRQTRFTPRVTKMDERPTHINNMLDDQLDEWDLGDDPQIKLLNQLMEQPQRQKKEKKQQSTSQNLNQSNLQQSQSQQQISVSTQPTNKFSFGENKAKQMFQPETVESVEDSFRQDRSQRMNTSRDRSRNKIPAKSNPKYKQQQIQQEPVEEQYDEDQLEDLKRSKSSNQENTYDQKLKQFKKYDCDPYSVNYQNQTQEQYKPRKSRISERQNRTIPQRPLQEMDFFDRLKFAFGCLTRRQ